MPKYLWKSLSKGLKSYHGKHEWEIGKWHEAKGPLSMCRNGFHASKEVMDSMFYVPMECLAKVEVKGKHEDQDDKQCWQQMKIVKAWEWEKKDSVALAIYAAELVLENFEKQYPNDKRPRKAIEAAKKWLRNPTKKNESASRSASESASESAARSAESAARSAAWSAESAAWSAAWSATWSAARSATLKYIKMKIEAWIQERIKGLKEIKGGNDELYESKRH